MYGGILGVLLGVAWFEVSKFHLESADTGKYTLLFITNAI